MEIKFDRYTWRARVLPVYLTAAPAVLAIAATLPEGLNLPLAGASAVVFVPLSYFLSQIASDFGKRLEPALWKSWGGPPTTRFLRHDNDEFNPATRERVHERLRALGLDIQLRTRRRRIGRGPSISTHPLSMSSDASPATQIASRSSTRATPNMGSGETCSA